MRRYRFHLLGLVHLPCTREYIACAFTQKNYKLAEMLLSLGHEVFYYGAEGSNLPCTKFIQTHSLADICREWGDGDSRFQVGYDWKSTEFRHDFNKSRTQTTLQYFGKCIEAITRIKRPGDFLLLSQGQYQRPVAKALNMFLTAEPGVGYRGSYCRFRAFESSYIQNFTYGSEHPFKCINGNYYDRVIPNYFQPNEVLFGEKAQDYFLYIGRIIKRKGIITAHLASKALGKKLIILGQGGKVHEDGSFSADKDPDFKLEPGTWEYHGFADMNKRKTIMSQAKATFVPTEYLECFAGTHIESMLCGTPVITTNFGVFPGTVINGFNGYRCDTLNDFVEAGRKVGDLDRREIRKHADQYLTTNVRLQYQKWFDDLYQVFLSVSKKAPGWHYIKP